MAYFPIKTKNERKIVLIKPTSDNTLLKKNLIVFSSDLGKFLGFFELWNLDSKRSAILIGFPNLLKNLKLKVFWQLFGERVEFDFSF